MIPIIDVLRKNIEAIEKEIEYIQNKCPHRNKTSKGWFNDYDGYSEVKINYFESFHCLDCDKHWEEKR